ncbi:MAG: DinB family protein [Bryobacteraceae bacterium]|jgi:hypothetical protein
MNRRNLSVMLAGALCFGAAAHAAPPTVASLYDSMVTAAEHDIVPLAQAMPDDKYGFAPTNGEFNGVRDFCDQIKHLAAVMYIASAASLQEKLPVDVGSENGPPSIVNKNFATEFLRYAFAYAHKAALALTEQNQLELVKSPFGEGQIPRAQAVAMAVWHAYDHYGQMVEYARMNGVIPPASRKQ